MRPRRDHAVDRHDRRPHLFELDPIGDEKVEHRHRGVRERTDDLAIVVAGLRMIGPRVLHVNLVGRIVDVELLLNARSAAEADVPPAQDRVPADIRVLVDDDDRGAKVARTHRRRESGGARSHNDDVGGVIPGPGSAGLLGPKSAGDRRRADCRAVPDERSSAHVGSMFRIAHLLMSPRSAMDAAGHE